MRDFSSLLGLWKLKSLVIAGALLGLLSVDGCGNKRLSPSSFRVYSSVDTSLATIGDVLHFRVWARGAGNRIIHFPDFEMDDPDVSIVEKRILTGEYLDDLGVEFEITFWDTGSFTLPAYPVHIMSQTSTSIDYTLEVDPVTVAVQTVIADSHPELRDVKRPVPIPAILPVRMIVSVAAIFVLLITLVWLWKKRIPPKGIQKRIVIPSRPPCDVAMEKLSTLETKDLSSPSGVKEFYIALSYIVREFIEHQYFIRTVEMTTEEIELSKSLLPVDGDLVDLLMDVLCRADLAKFARFQPERDRCRNDLRAMKSFVQTCRIEWSPLEQREHQLEAV